MKKYFISFLKNVSSFTVGIFIVLISFLFGFFFWIGWHSNLATNKSIVYFLVDLIVIFPLHLVGLFLIRKFFKNIILKIFLICYIFIFIYFITYPLYGLLDFDSIKYKMKISPDYNLLFIVSDSLRADALSCYGGEANTPNICGLAKEGVLFENAYSNASWTQPSLFSLFTGNFPSCYINILSALKVQKNIIEATKDNNDGFFDTNILISAGQFFKKIRDKSILLGDVLKERDYNLQQELNYSLPSGFYPEQLNFFRGFEKLPDINALSKEVIVYIEENAGIKNLSEGYARTYGILNYLLNNKNNNFYLVDWINDPHEPYSPPEKYIKNINVDYSRLSKSPDYYSSYVNISDKERSALLAPYEKQYLKQLYLKEVESVDERLGYILGALKKKGLMDKTIIVFTADHGEAFGEHGGLSHGHTYFNEEIQIPLIMAGPGIKKDINIKKAVSHVDIMPTLGEIMKTNIFNNRQGKSFMSLLSGNDDKEIDRVQYIEGSSSGGVALIKDNYKLIINNDSTVNLFDLLNDPNEFNDISEKNQVIVDTMKKKAFQIRLENMIKNQTGFEI